MVRHLRKHNNRGLGRALVLLAALSLGMVSHSCRNPGDITTTSRTELERFINTSEDIRDLFDFDVYARDSFIPDSGAATIRFATIASKSMGEVFIPTNSSGPITNKFGTAPFIVTNRLDNFKGTFLQRNDSASADLEYPFETSLLRRALFMRLGTSGDRFFGWELVGLDLGLPLVRVADKMTIRKIPAKIGFPTVLSNFESGFRTFSYLIDYKSVKAGDSIDIRTKQGPMTVFARTNTGFRLLPGVHSSSDPANVFRYGFRTPPAIQQNRFYHFITFQQGPETKIDSTIYHRFVILIDTLPLVPPDTLFDSMNFRDTTFDSVFSFFDICQNIFVDDTVPLDTCVIKEFDGEIKTNIVSRVEYDTMIITTTIDTTFDSILAPDSVIEDGDVWLYPYFLVN